jgi:hypothetical protein
MIEQRQSYTNNQKQMQNKTTPKKKEKEIMVNQVCSNCCARRVGETTHSSSDKSVCT